MAVTSNGMSSGSDAIQNALLKYKINRHHVCYLVPLNYDTSTAPSTIVSSGDREGETTGNTGIPCSPAQIGSTSANVTSQYVFVDPEDGCSDITTDLTGVIAVIMR